MAALSVAASGEDVQQKSMRAASNAHPLAVKCRCGRVWCAAPPTYSLGTCSPPLPCPCPFSMHVTFALSPHEKSRSLARSLPSFVLLPRSPGHRSTLGILPSSSNPPIIAHTLNVPSVAASGTHRAPSILDCSCHVPDPPSACSSYCSTPVRRPSSCSPRLSLPSPQ